MSGKMLNQDKKSRERTEELCRLAEEEYGINLSLKDAEALLTQKGLRVAKEQGVSALLDDN
jgi:hypothetical protein